MGRVVTARCGENKIGWRWLLDGTAVLKERYRDLLTFDGESLDAIHHVTHLRHISHSSNGTDELLSLADHPVLFRGGRTDSLRSEHSSASSFTYHRYH